MNNKLISALTTVIFVTILRQLVINAQSPQFFQPYPTSSILQTNLSRISDSFSRKINLSYKSDVLYLANKRTFLANAKEEEQSPPIPTQTGGRR